MDDGPLVYDKLKKNRFVQDNLTIPRFYGEIHFFFNISRK